MAGALYLQVAGINGPIPTSGGQCANDFNVPSYSLDTQAGDKGGPLVVTLAASNETSTGAAALFGKFLSQSYLSSITLDVANNYATTDGESSLQSESIQLTDAKITGYSDSGGQITLTLEYYSATIASHYWQNPTEPIVRTCDATLSGDEPAS